MADRYPNEFSGGHRIGIAREYHVWLLEIADRDEFYQNSLHPIPKRCWRRRRSPIRN